jgi:hypothetical protein
LALPFFFFIPAEPIVLLVNMEFTTAKALIELAIVLAVMWFALVHRRTQPTLPLPPGPPAEFLLGHTRLIPKENTAATYARWAREYGE